MYLRKIFVVSLLTLSTIVLAEELTANQRAIEAARVAAEAAAQAVEAQKAVEKAVSAAKKAAEQANQLAEWSYIDMIAEQRQARIEMLPPAPKPPKVSVPTKNPIDRFIAARWSEQDSPELCDYEAFLRRVYLDVVGYIPPADEAEEFLKSSDPDKREKKIDELLARDEDYAVHWTQFWEDALCSNGNHQGGVGTRSNFKEYIIKSFQANKPYDVFVIQLLDPTSFNYRGGYVKADTHLDSVQTAANVGQVFLGTRMKCASCHDHFLNFEWPQKRFMGFASYFAEADLELIRCEVKLGETIKPQFIFDLDNTEEGELETLEQRLHEVTKLIIDPANPRFASAFVNRLWKRYLGLGLIEPVDDFREDTPASHPELLHWLSYEFIANDYDVKHIVRLILNSRTYQLKFEPGLADRYEAGSTYARLFRSPSLRRLTCEQVMDSLNIALGHNAKRITFDTSSNGLTRALGRPETRNEVVTVRSDDIAVIQALEMMNGEYMNELVYESPLVDELVIADYHKDAAQEAFLRIYSRFPTEEETKATLAFLGDSPGKSEWGDMLWALVVSPQFQYVY